MMGLYPKHYEGHCIVQQMIVDEMKVRRKGGEALGDWTGGKQGLLQGRHTVINA